MKMMVTYALSCDVVKNFRGMSRSVFAFAHAPCFLRRCGSGYCFSSSAGEILRKGDLQLGNASAGGERSVVLEEESELEVKRHQVGGLDVSFPTYMVWGANTGVGKTLVSAGLSAAIVCQLENTSYGFRQGRALGNTDLLYVKPVQTGFPLDSDARYVFQEVSRVARLHPQAIPHGLFVCNHTLQVSPAVHRSVRETDSSTSSNSAWGVGESLSGPNGTGMKDLCSYESQLLQGVKIKDWHEVPFARSAEFTQNLSRVNGGVRSDRDRPPSPSHFTCQTMWSWFDPVSPHLAAAKEGSAVSDLLVLDSLQSALGSLSSGTYKIQQKDTCDNWMRKWAIVETAGGVASPGPSGTLQCDLYRPLRLPGVLVGDGRLGGISTTIGAYEMLRMRGYDIPAVILVDAGLSNQEPLLQYLQHKIPVLVLPCLPEDPNKPLADWFSMANQKFAELRDVLEVSHLRRMERLEEMSRKAHQSVWWPFTQHSLVAEDAITVIDSRSGENFSVYKGGNDSQNDVIETQFDACASWWTQGPDATLQPELAREAAYSAGRYGHVMFPENVHEPALRCAELLLQGVGQGWAERVFFSDNGATSIEVAIKMAFRRFVVDHCMEDSFNHEHKQQHFKVLALQGSYHGDTLGALEAQAPSAYTGFLQQPWYSGRGLFLEPPTVFLQNGRWRVHLPENYCSVECSAYTHGWKSRDEIFDMGRDATPLADVYSKFIEEQLTSLAVREETTSLAALIIEPVIHGAGGMEMLDPLFQRVLICACQRRHIPVIFDEVLSGCWRLGAESAAELLGCTPDIACYSKLLTGGLVPLAATLATSSVFEAFRGDSKLDALLHGHSYTAHAVGCSSAVISLQYFSNPAKNPNLLPGGRRLRELWSSELVSQISSHHAVQRVVSLGTIFALELQASDAEAGYASMVSKGLVEGLRRDGIYTRPLGNVVYLMCGPLTKPETCTILLRKLLAVLK